MKAGFCAILGRPNVGKSTLINALLSKKVSIVTPRAQTTREDVSGIYNEKGLQIVFIDTPGLFEGKEALDKIMDKAARQSISGIDVILYLIDATQSDFSADDKVLASIKTSKPIILIFNKVDLATAPLVTALAQHYQELYPSDQQIEASALKNYGLKEIKEMVASHLSEGEPFYPAGQLTDKDHPFMAKEVIRQELLHFLKEEIPHQCAVTITSFEEKKDSCKIKAMISCEKDTQKAIVIGRGGTMIKKISMSARHELEKMWRENVTLICEVDCLPGWRNNPEKLKKLGYGKGGDN